MINNDILQMLFYYFPNTAFVEFSRSTSANHCHVEPSAEEEEKKTFTHPSVGKSE